MKSPPHRVFASSSSSPDSVNSYEGGKFTFDRTPLSSNHNHPQVGVVSLLIHHFLSVCAMKANSLSPRPHLRVV